LRRFRLWIVYWSLDANPRKVEETDPALLEEALQGDHNARRCGAPAALEVYYDAYRTRDHRTKLGLGQVEPAASGSTLRWGYH
jgi:hypothetical protein